MTRWTPEISRRGLLLGAAAGMAAPALGGLSSAAWAQAPSQLIIGIAGGGATDNLDPHLPNGAASSARVINLFEQLTQVGPDFSLTNRLAEELTPNADATEWTVRLREGVEFHNGKTLTSDDLIYTVRRILDPETRAFGRGQIGFIDPERIERLDDRTVRFGMKRPFALFATAFGDGGLIGIVPEGFDPAAPVGTGPYKLREFVPGQVAIFDRFENYWGAQAHVDSVQTFNFSDDSARINALLAGQVQAVNQVPLNLLRLVEGAEGVNTSVSPSGLFNAFTMRTDVRPFDDVRVRQAFRMMIDRNALVQQVYGGHATVGNDLYSPFDPAFASDLVREYDPDQAQWLLNEAGYANMRIELVVAPMRAGMVETATVMAAHAAAIGVQIQIRQVDVPTLRGEQFLQWPFACHTFPGLSYWTTASLADAPGAVLNTTHFADTEFGALAEQAQAEMDAGKRNELFHAMQVIQFERGGYLAPAWPSVADAFSQNVQGVGADLTGLGLNRNEFATLSLT